MCAQSRRPNCFRTHWHLIVTENLWQWVGQRLGKCNMCLALPTYRVWCNSKSTPRATGHKGCNAALYMYIFPVRSWILKNVCIMKIILNYLNCRGKQAYIHIWIHTYVCLTLSLLFCFLFTAHFVNTTEIKLRSKNCLKLRAHSPKNFLLREWKRAGQQNI